MVLGLSGAALLAQAASLRCCMMPELLAAAFLEPTVFSQI